MRAQGKRAHREEEEESAFISMTDMTVGFLFIMMILLAFFVSQIRETEVVSLADYEAVVEQRDNALELIETVELALKMVETQAETILILFELVETQQDKIVLLETELAELQAKINSLDQIDPLEIYLAQVAQVRRDVLQKLREALLLDFPELKIELSEESDALRFQGEGMFKHDRAELLTQKEAIVARLSQRLDDILPCFTIGTESAFSEECNSGFVMIEAVQIEGHTDADGADERNRVLSAERANNTFFAMNRAAPRVMKHLNLKQQPVLSVAAYGPDRPIALNDSREGKATNRRIDLRFIMVMPKDTDGIAAIRQALGTISEESQ